jgi:DNA-3-methyladenine glycosylase
MSGRTLKIPKRSARHPGCTNRHVPDTPVVTSDESPRNTARQPLSAPLPRSFFERDARKVARELIGCRIVHRLGDGARLVLRLVEVEAYLGDGSDPASHAHRGPTPRNRTMFGPPGRLYTYRSYGIHICANVVCGPNRKAEAVLLRAAEPIEGTERMRVLRGLAADAKDGLIARGPGRFGQALGLGLDHDGQSLLRPPLTLHARAPGSARVRIETGPRVGITRAADLTYRYFEADSPWVSSFRKGGGRRARSVAT